MWENEIASLPELNDWLVKVSDIALEAGKLIKKLAEQSVEITYKGPVDLVTQADLAAEKHIIDRLRGLFPDHGILAEEAGGDRDREFLWVVDPVDGTTNYAHGFPLYAVSIGLLVNRKSVLGVVYEPNLDELFTAVAGGGARLNGRPISVSRVDTLDKALLATGFPYFLRENHRKILDDFARISLTCQGIRRAGAATIDLCNLACGRFDGFWEVGLKPWDSAAAALIAQEAGAKVTKYDGSAFDHFVPEIVATNGLLHNSLLQLL